MINSPGNVWRPGWWCPMIMDGRVKRNIIESITRSLMRPQITQAADTRCCPLWLADIGVWCPEQNTSPGPCQDCQQCGVYQCGLVTRSPVTDITAHCWAHSDHWASDLGEKIPGGARAGPAPDITSNNAPPARAPHVSSQHCFHKIFIKWEMLMGSNHWETSSTSQIYRMMVPSHPCQDLS